MNDAGQLVVPTETPTLYGQKILLRRVRPEDQAVRQSYGVDADIERLDGGSPKHNGIRAMSAEEAGKWFQRHNNDSSPWNWMIVRKDLSGEEQIIGTCRLHEVEPENRRARYAIGLYSNLGQGTGQDVTATVLDYAFNTAGFHRIDLRVLENNTRAIACYLKSGFQIEGTEKETLHVDGTWRSDVIMAILEQEYKQA